MRHHTPEGFKIILTMFPFLVNKRRSYEADKRRLLPAHGQASFIFSQT